MVQEHHARALHWDLRLEHDGVLWSWAVPKGIPMRNRPNHLAVRTEDHPLEYLDFEADIPAGQYGAGTMRIWDAGTYEPEKLRDDEVIVTFHGGRVDGKYALFRTGGTQWMLHRMSPPDDPTRTAVPTDLRPMSAVAADPPAGDRGWVYEMKWDGMRALLAVEGGRVRMTSRTGTDITDRFPELGLGAAMGTTEAVLDGEIVALDASGRPSFERLQPRIHVGSPAKARQLAATDPVAVMLFDVLWLEGHSTVALPYRDRRALLEGLALAGPHWQTPPAREGDCAAMLAPPRSSASRGGRQARRQPLPAREALRRVAQGEGDGQPGARRRRVAPRQGPPGRPARLAARRLPRGAGRRAPLRRACRLGHQRRHAGRARGCALHPGPPDSPFLDPPRLLDPAWVDPELVVDVAFHEWTTAGSLPPPLSGDPRRQGRRRGRPRGTLRRPAGPPWSRPLPRDPRDRPFEGVHPLVEGDDRTAQAVDDLGFARRSSSS